MQWIGCLCVGFCVWRMSQMLLWSTLGRFFKCHLLHKTSDYIARSLNVMLQVFYTPPRGRQKLLISILSLSHFGSYNIWSIKACTMHTLWQIIIYNGMETFAKCQLTFMKIVSTWLNNGKVSIWSENSFMLWKMCDGNSSAPLAHQNIFRNCSNSNRIFCLVTVAKNQSQTMCEQREKLQTSRIEHFFLLN